jgi:hypothetical protein
MFALGTGLACGIAAARYPDVIGPPYAAILGTLIIYPGGRRPTTRRRSRTRRGIHRRRGISAARVRVADVGSEEFEEAHRGALAGGGGERRQPGSDHITATLHLVT